MTPLLPRLRYRAHRPARVGVHAVADQQRGIVAWAWTADPGDALDGCGGPLAGSGTFDGTDTVAAHLAAIADASELIISARGQVELQVGDEQVRAGVEALALPAVRVVFGLSLSCDARDVCLRALGVATLVRPEAEEQAWLPRLLVATDGSYGRGGGTPAAGWAWVDGQGRFHTGAARLKAGGAGPNVAEVRAVISAVNGHHRHRRLLIRTDSAVAIRLADAARSGRDESFGLPPNEVSALRRAITGRDVLFEWVPGHSGDPMNECADRLAVAARRSHQLATDPNTADAVFHRIAAEYREPIAALQAGEDAMAGAGGTRPAAPASA